MTSTKKAVSEVISNHDDIYISGFHHLEPYSLTHEVIRQGYENLTVIRPVVADLVDQMIAAGCVSKVVCSYTVGPSFERALKKGVPTDLELEEYTHYGIVSMIHSGARNMPFVPIRSIYGSSLPEYNDNIKFVENPYNGEKTTVLPAVEPDVTFLHAQQADEKGNVKIWGLPTDSLDAAYAADSVIVSVEEIVSSETLASDPNQTIIPANQVDHITHEPYGAHPSFAQGYYGYDEELFDYREKAETKDGAEQWLDEWVYSVSSREEYLEKIGFNHLASLAPPEKITEGHNIGDY